MTNLLARARKLTGTWPAAVILVRLAYWMPRTKIIRDGSAWVALSREQWMEETALSLGEYKRGLERIRELNLIESATHLYGGKVRSFMRLTEHGAECLSVPISWHAKAPNLWHASEPIIKDTTYPIKEIKGKGVKLSGSKNSRQKNIAKSPEAPLTGEVEKMIKPKSVLDVEGLVKGQKVLHKPDSVKSLEFIWKQAIVENHGSVVVNLTNKHLGMLKQIRDKSEGKAEGMLQFIVSDWVWFAKEVQSQVGLGKIPTQPNLEFLLKHLGIALTVFSQASPKKLVTQEAKTISTKAKVQLISQPTPAPSPSEKPASLQDVLAILADDDEED